MMIKQVYKFYIKEIFIKYLRYKVQLLFNLVTNPKWLIIFSVIYNICLCNIVHCDSIFDKVQNAMASVAKPLVNWAELDSIVKEEDKLHIPEDIPFSWYPNAVKKIAAYCVKGDILEPSVESDTSFSYQTNNEKFLLTKEMFINQASKWIGYTMAVITDTDMTKLQKAKEIAEYLEKNYGRIIIKNGTTLILSLIF